MIEYLAGRIADNQIGKGRIAGYDRAIYQYGYVLLMETGINIFLSVVLGVICHTLPEVLLFLLFFIPLRSYAGGWHMAHAWQCILVTNITILCVTLAAAFLSRYLSAGFLLGADILACAVICIMSPIDTEAKPLEEDEKIIYRKKARIICISELFINMIISLLSWNRFLCVISMSHCILVFSLILEKNNKKKKCRQ